MVANDKLSEEIKFSPWSQQTVQQAVTANLRVFEEIGYVLFPMNVTSHLKRGRKFLLDQKYTNKGNTLRPEGNLPFYE